MVVYFHGKNSKLHKIDIDSSILQSVPIGKTNILTKKANEKSNKQKRREERKDMDYFWRACVCVSHPSDWQEAFDQARCPVTTLYTIKNTHDNNILMYTSESANIICHRL